MSARCAVTHPPQLLCLVLLGVSWPVAQAAAPLIPVEVFAAGPEMSAPRVSPDGTHLSYVTTVQGERFVGVYDVQAGKSMPILRGTSGTFRVTRCDFKTDKRLLCHFHGTNHNFGAGPQPSSRLIVVDRDGKNLKVLFQGGYYSDSTGTTQTQFQDRILHMLPDDPQHVLIEMGDRSSIFPSVYQLDVDTGALRTVVMRQPPVLGWVADRDGVVRFGSGFRDKEALYIARNGANAPWRTLAKFQRFDRQQFEPLGFGPLPNQLFVAAPHQGRTAVWQMDLEEKSDFQLVFARPDVDAESIVSWPTDEHIVGFFYEDDRPHVEFLDAHARTISQTMDQVLPDTFHHFLSASRDGRLIVIESYSDVVPPTYHLLDTATRSLTALGQESRALAHAQLAPTASVVIPGPGGISIHGYLTLPVGYTPGKPIAAVVFPHGGPYSRDYWGYDPMVQLMANRGYAVLQTNFRGSTGYGEQWQRAGHQAWGTIMHEDITAGAHWLVSQGIADPARMCIVGWSYGGYAALIGVVKEPQLYKCAVSIAGVSDVSQLAWDNRPFYGGTDAARESTGTDKATLAAESPVLHADRIKVPVLLVHGEEDSTVVLGQSKAMAKALESHGVPHELVVIKDGEHSLLEPSMRLTLYSKLEAFLAANLGSP
jgi:dienelactone hydrolase